MDDKKQNNTNPNTPDDTSVDYLTQKAKESKIEFGSAGHDDINKNLGSFGNTVAKPATTQAEVKLDVDAKIVEKAAAEKINFERFTKTRRQEKAAKTRFGERVSMMLRTKKGLRRTWIIELVSMVVIIAVAATFIGILGPYNGHPEDGPLRIPFYQTMLSIGIVFAWISIFPCVIPLVYLVTTWFVGINQVASSRMYHYMFWICGLISLVCFIVGIVLLAFPMHAWIIY
ncbi:MAG: hypothetical protein ACOQNY_00520 [Mycoplasmoidaceae bacterium]